MPAYPNIKYQCRWATCSPRRPRRVSPNSRTFQLALQNVSPTSLRKVTNSNKD